MILTLVSDTNTTQPLMVSANPNFLFENVGISSGNTGTIDITVTGGSGVYTHLWEFLTLNGTGNMTVNSPTSEDTTFHYEGLDNILDFVSGTVRHTATDTFGNVGFINITIGASRTS